MRDTLIITSQPVISPVTPASAYEYRVDDGRILGDGTILLNDSEQLNRLGAELAGPYTEAIAQLRLKMPWKALNDETLGHLFYLTELNTKRTEINESFDAFVNATFLREKLSDKTIRRIYIYGSTFFHDDTLHSIFPDAQIIRDQTPKQAPRIKSILLKNSYYFLRFWLVALMRWAVPKVKSSDLKAERFFMTRYPGRLSDQEIEDKYSDLVRPQDRFIAGILTDGMQQNVSFFHWLRMTRKARYLRQTIFYDRFHHVSDGLAGFFWMLALTANIAREKPVVRINDITLSEIIHDEAIFSLYRLPRMIAVSRGIKRLYNRINKNKSGKKTIVYYLHEYGYGRMYTSILSRFFPNLNRIGMQHGPASIRKLVYWLSNEELQDRNHPLAIPHAVLAEDRASGDLYRKMGYNHVMVMKKPPRLRGPFEKLITVAKDRSNLPHLIATGLHDSPMMIAMMIPIIEQNPKRDYLIKFHPKALINDAILSSLPKNCKVVTEDISLLFMKVGHVYVTYSSVGIEAEEIGLDVSFMDIPARVSERPDVVTQVNEI